MSKSKRNRDKRRAKDRAEALSLMDFAERLVWAYGTGSKPVPADEARLMRMASIPEQDEVLNRAWSAFALALMKERDAGFDFSRADAGDRKRIRRRAEQFVAEGRALDFAGSPTGPGGFMAYEVSDSDDTSTLVEDEEGLNKAQDAWR